MVGARRANDTYGFALEAHPGKSRGGQVLTRARSATYKNGLPSRVRSRMPRDPDGLTVLTSPETLNSCNGPVVGAATSTAFHTGYQRDRSAQPPTAQSDQDQGQLPLRGRRPQADLPRGHQRRARLDQDPQLDVALLAFKIAFGDRVPDAS